MFLFGEFLQTCQNDLSRADETLDRNNAEILITAAAEYMVRAGVSVTWNVLSWSGGHEFEPRSGWTWDALYFCLKSYLNQKYN